MSRFFNGQFISCFSSLLINYTEAILKYPRANPRYPLHSKPFSDFSQVHDGDLMRITAIIFNGVFFLGVDISVQITILSVWCSNRSELHYPNRFRYDNDGIRTRAFIRKSRKSEFSVHVTTW